MSTCHSGVSYVKWTFIKKRFRHPHLDFIGIGAKRVASFEQENLGDTYIPELVIVIWVVGALQYQY